MGNSSSSARGHHDDTVDFGSLVPQGVYTGPQDWNQATVAQLIVQRKLAPFYRPLEEYDESWDDERILASRKEPPENSESANHNESLSAASSSKADAGSSFRSHGKRPSTQKEVSKFSEAAIYRGAVECPICFLYYPPNINHSRCCDQAICTECFVQIKRSEPTTTHLVSEPAACPYCVQEHFGVVYTPPSWRTGIGSDGSTPPSWPDSPKNASSSEAAATRARRRKSFGADSPEVVTIDQIRPDWEAKLAAVRAQAQRRANRRIIMRQVGDRLIPIGVTSGRVHALTEDGGEAEGNRPGGRRRRRNQGQNPALDRLLGQVDIAGQDLEELMIMEAMRLSLLEHEQHQQRQREEEERNRQNGETSERGRSMEAGNNASLVIPSGQRSSSMVPPEPAEERVDPRPSSSVPNNNPMDGLDASGNWQRDSQFSTLVAALNTTNTMSATLMDSSRSPPLSSSTTRTGGIDIDAATISSDSSGTGHSFTGPIPDPVDETGVDVDYTTLPSSPESSNHPRLAPQTARNDEAETSSRSRTPE